MNEDLPAGGGEIILSAEVWPTHVGFAVDDPGFGPQPAFEPTFSIDYERGQISWATMPNGEIIGHTKVVLPAGTYTHMLYLHGPGELPMMCGRRQLPHPVTLTSRGEITVDPIAYRDWVGR